MEYLFKHKLLDNNILEIYSNYKYPTDFINRLNNFFSNKKIEILDFFMIEDFRKVRINLFFNKVEYKEYIKNKIKISAYNIGCCYQGNINYICTSSDLQNFGKAGYIIASIVHEFVHIIYNERMNKERNIWFEEGIAQCLSGQRAFLEYDKYKYKEWLEKNIFEKELPPIKYLKRHGSKYGEFCDCETEKYDGYDISYALVRYVIENYKKEEIINFIRYPENVDEEEIYNNFIKYRNRGML